MPLPHFRFRNLLIALAVVEVLLAPFVLLYSHKRQMAAEAAREYVRLVYPDLDLARCNMVIKLPGSGAKDGYVEFRRRDGRGGVRVILYDPDGFTEIALGSTPLPPERK